MKLNENCHFEIYDDGDAVIYDSVKKNTLILNETSAWILELLIENESIDEAKKTYIESVKKNYDICETDNPDADFDEILTMLEDENVVSR